LKNEYNDQQLQDYQKPSSVVGSSRQPNHTRNISASVGQHNNSYNGDPPVKLNQNIRPLPVYERENVFNEWGAVIKHQDEIDRELRRIQDEKMRQRQKNYKMQLDLQYQEWQDRKKGALSQQARKEDNILKQYQRDLEDKRKAEDEKRNQVINQQKNAAFQSINEMNTMKQQQQNIRDMERDLYSNKMKTQEELENKRKQEEKEKMKSDQVNYSRILQIQHKSKVDKKQFEKATDRHFSQAEKEQMNKHEDQRNLFFQKLNKIQEVNDMKQKKLQEYMEQDPKEIRSRQDEANYLKDIENTEKKNLIKDHEIKNKKEHDQVDNYRSLGQQLQERQLQHQNVKMQENAIANYYNKEADKYRLEVEDEKRKKQRSKEDYYKALASQINENKKKKQYSVLMSEHERRVNDKDIKAYEYKDTTNLFSKVIGFGGDDKLDKYIDKSMHNKSSHNSPERPSGKAPNMNSSMDQGSNLAKMGKMSLNSSTNILTDAPMPSRVVSDNPYLIGKLQKVRENMEKQDAFKYRANTNNRGYGFDQSMIKETPANKVIPRQDVTNPYEYNFTAPGNY